jgi:hypothetical protein
VEARAPRPDDRKEIVMKRHFGAALGIGLAAILLAGSVASAAVVVIVSVPFSFMVGEKELPPGRYEVRQDGPGLQQITVQNLGNGAKAVALAFTRLADTGTKDAKTVFDNADGKYYLAEVHIPGLDGVALTGAPGRHTHTSITGTSTR